MDNLRVGIGYDSHRLVEGRRLILGGVDIPSKKGLQGRSDADVLTHALMDALLGAAGLGDIGMHFPDTDQCMIRTRCTLPHLPMLFPFPDGIQGPPQYSHPCNSRILHSDLQLSESTCSSILPVTQNSG